MKVSSTQSTISYIIFSCVLMVFSSYVVADARTLFDHCLVQLVQDPHCIFSVEDAFGLSRDPRFQNFLQQYNRYTLVKEPLADDSFGAFYEKDSSSALMCNAFLRWSALKNGELDVKALTGQELDDSLVHINYLLYSFGPQVLERNAWCPALDTEKVTRLSILRKDILLELESRNSVLVKAVTPSPLQYPKPALWVLGDQYEKISHVSWDQSGRYLICLGYKKNKQKVLIYSFDAPTLALSLCAEMPVSIEGFQEFEPTHLLWGPDAGLIVLGGNSPDRRHSVTCSYVFNSLKNSITFLRTIQQVAGYEVATRQAFWSSDMSCLCIVKAGECVVFRWDKPSLSFVLEKVVYPGLNRVVSASLSYDMNYFLTSHIEFPFVRLTKSGAPLGVFASAQFTDKLLDPQWNPKTLSFVARSQVEADVIILYEYNPLLDRVYLTQRIHVGAAVNSMKWSTDGSFLFVSGDASMLYGSGVRAYAFDGKLLRLCRSFDDSALGTTMVTEAAYLPSKNVLLLAGMAHDFASGVVFSLASTLPKKHIDVKNVLQNTVSADSVSSALPMASDPSVVYQYLDEVPTEKNIVFGSVLMLANAQDSSRGLAACDAPEVRCAHNGKAFPCARTLKQGDVSGELLSCWWIVEGEAWLDRIDKSVKPFAQISLKNLATGDKLCLTKEHAPINGISCDQHFVGLVAEDGYVSIGRSDSSCEPWCVGERVQLKTNDGCVALADAPFRHPILQKMGISGLAVAPASQDPTLASLWSVSRNISLSTIFSQALKGSECCDFLLKRIDALWGKDLKQVVMKSLQAGLARGI